MRRALYSLYAAARSPAPCCPHRATTQVLIEKYGLSEEQLAPKLARMAKQGFTVKKAGASGTATASGAPSQTATQKSPSATASGPVAMGTEALGGASSGAGVPHGGTAVAAIEAQQAAQTQSLVRQLHAQQAAQRTQMAAALQAQAQVQSQMGTAPALPPGIDAAGMSLLLDDEFLDEVRTWACLAPAHAGAAGAGGWRCS